MQNPISILGMRLTLISCIDDRTRTRFEVWWVTFDTLRPSWSHVFVFVTGTHQMARTINTISRCLQPELNARAVFPRSTRSVIFKSTIASAAQPVFWNEIDTAAADFALCVSPWHIAKRVPWPVLLDYWFQFFQMSFSFIKCKIRMLIFQLILFQLNTNGDEYFFKALLNV